MLSLKFLAIFIQIIIFCNAFINYLNIDGLAENDSCYVDEELYGICKKIKNCQQEYDRFKVNKTELNICQFSKKHEDNLICCPSAINKPQKMKRPNFLKPEICRERMIKIRSKKPNFEDVFYQFQVNGREVPRQQCAHISNTQVINYKGVKYGCKNGEIVSKKFRKYQKIKLNFIQVSGGSALTNKRIEPFEISNVVAIGWIQEDDSISFKCGGSIITEKFVLTSAHCQEINGRFADVIRVGDRFLNSPQDDDHSQMIKIKKIILHPHYKPPIQYHDIALVMTETRIFMNEFVSHACISGLDYYDGFLGVAAYREVKFENFLKFNLI